jgi:hypothetical protein
MISGLDLNATVEYTLKSDTDNPTVWKLGIIPSYLFARISADAPTKEIQTAYRVLQIAIKGWENFNVPFTTEKEKLFDREIDCVPLSTLERLPLNVVTELAGKIMEINGLTAEEKKT